MNQVPGTNFFTKYNTTVDIALIDLEGNASLIRCTAANLPSAIANYAIGCIAYATDTGVLYTNTGTASSCTFTAVDSSTSLTLPSAFTDSTSTTGTSFGITANSVTTGKGISVTANGLTTGSGLFVSTTGTYTGTAGVLSVTANSATTGSVAVINGTGLTTGKGLLINATAATLTTGRYISVNDAATEVFGIGNNGHIISTASAVPPTVAVTTQAGITAAAITAGGSDTAGVITTTGTSTGATVITVTFGKTYTTAPKTVSLTPANAAAAMPNTGYIVGAITATTFTITVAAGGTYAATPSWYYQVIA